MIWIALLVIGIFLWNKKSTVKVIDAEKTCSAGYHWDTVLKKCVLDGEEHTCPPGSSWDSVQQICIADIECLVGYHWDPGTQKCQPDATDNSTPTWDNVLSYLVAYGGQWESGTWQYDDLIARGGVTLENIRALYIANRDYKDWVVAIAPAYTTVIDCLRGISSRYGQIYFNADWGLPADWH
jgi:hypothetical protein